ncbi:MAG: type II toxin-antitoxin system Y4mF family antitoxin [Deltaproteobacteria bacterium]|nr:type II toxin-antitoxin system Y4mF family antitoxin [Deltaproteobacteria bacterium]
MKIASPKDLGALVRAERKTAGLTQERLAALAGVSPRFVVELEGGRASAGVGLVLRVLSTLGLDVDVNARAGEKR